MLLWSLTTLFALRVAAQLLQYARPVRFLPPFEAWQGSRLSYPVLLASQLVILVVMFWGANAVSRRVSTRRRVGAWLVALGWVYLGSMSVRLVLGLTLLAHVAWFAKPIPALFHMVLAGYVLTFGRYHSTHDDRPRVAGSVLTYYRPEPKVRIAAMNTPQAANSADPALAPTDEYATRLRAREQ